jgi:hypothetical protein
MRKLRDSVTLGWLGVFFGLFGLIRIIRIVGIHNVESTSTTFMNYLTFLGGIFLYLIVAGVFMLPVVFFWDWLMSRINKLDSSGSHGSHDLPKE